MPKRTRLEFNDDCSEPVMVSGLDGYGGSRPEDEEEEGQTIKPLCLFSSVDFEDLVASPSPSRKSPRRNSIKDKMEQLHSNFNTNFNAMPLSPFALKSSLQEEDKENQEPQFQLKTVSTPRGGAARKLFGSPLKRSPLRCSSMSALPIGNQRAALTINTASMTTITITPAAGATTTTTSSQHSESLTVRPKNLRLEMMKAESSESLLSPGTLCDPTMFDDSLILPTMPGTHSDCNMIAPDTLCSLVQGQYKETSEQYFVIDCRFPYEFEGGHIEGAMNLYEPQAIEDFFFTKPMSKNTIIIFHCEFSQQRGPKMYRHLRDLDRKHHANCYPELFYPNIYVLEGGYKNFFFSTNCKLFCSPCEYVPMSDDRYVKECKEKFRYIRHLWKKQKLQQNAICGRRFSSVV